jgi:hypothetical protein
VYEGLNDGYLSNMKEFRYVDKVNNVAFRGIVPNNDKNCPPFLFFRLSHAYYLEKLFSDKVKASGLAPMPEYESRTGSGDGSLIRCLLAPLMWRNPVQSYS